MNIFYFVCGFLLVTLVDSVSNVSTTPAQTAEAPTTIHPVTTLTPEQECAARNSSCEECLKLAKCLYCKSNGQCTPYPVGKVLPPSSVCKLDHARWGVCWLNFEALIISMGVIGGLIIMVVTVCICCCCCCKDNKKKYAKEDEKWERKKADRKEKANERKAERRAKTDEIRRKYGLMKDDNPYERFENA
ncbi:Pituitary tumor-transforming gene 1 protein-interacting protein [Mytilus coruscus]|uniref:Pituitary tumor-transforming gene 1 protein-interacting protein n=1 Tax=Mytilus coruscus TaxID=42192 RepID=A0A6J8AIT3_MYTCO|nr:Pituitary tumor-transforming gene 1 protein-interacting protein [Mytilus coruscus]